MAMKWYVVHTYSGYEAKAKLYLEERIKTHGMEELFEEILIPADTEVDNKGKKTTKRFFPGYILIKMEMTKDSWHLVKGTQKITGFIGSTEHPSSVPEHEVERITRQIADGTMRAEPKQTFEEGVNVRVIDGPFLNFNGIVEEVKPEKQKLRVLVSIFGRATPVELDFSQVERV